jgi:uncharacterized lipoprotein NlpE involved in copper resistance
MQLLKSINTLILIGIILLGCNSSSQNDELKNLRTEVMAIHDEVMPKMGELRQVEKSLRSASEDQADSVGNAMIEAANAIGVANENMMVWMRNYDPTFAGEDEDVKAYLEEQKDAITKVRDDMLNSLEAGKELLNQ